MFRITRFIPSGIAALLLVCCVHWAQADCGSIPFYSPVITTGISLNSSHDGDGVGKLETFMADIVVR